MGFFLPRFLSRLSPASKADPRSLHHRPWTPGTGEITLYLLSDKVTVRREHRTSPMLNTQKYLRCLVSACGQKKRAAALTSEVNFTAIGGREAPLLPRLYLQNGHVWIRGNGERHRGVQRDRCVIWLTLCSPPAPSWVDIKGFVFNISSIPVFIF